MVVVENAQLQHGVEEEWETAVQVQLAAVAELEISVQVQLAAQEEWETAVQVQQLLKRGCRLLYRCIPSKKQVRHQSLLLSSRTLIQL